MASSSEGISNFWHDISCYKGTAYSCWYLSAIIILFYLLSPHQYGHFYLFQPKPHRPLRNLWFLIRHILRRFSFYFPAPLTDFFCNICSNDVELSFCIVLQVGMQNSSLGVVLATTHFASPLVALPPAMSAVIMNIMGSTLGFFWRHIDPSHSNISLEATDK